MNPQPAVGTRPENPKPQTASARAAARWSKTKPRRTIADRVTDCQLLGLGAALGVSFSGHPLLGLVVAPASWVVPAVAGAWIATRPRRPHAHSLAVDLTLDRKDR